MRISDWSSDVCSSDLQLLHGDATRGQRLRIGHDLPRSFHAAQGGDFGDVGYGLELLAQEPVMQRTQLAKIVLTGPINQRELVDPAKSRGIATQVRRNDGRQLNSCLSQLLKNALTPQNHN